MVRTWRSILPILLGLVLSAPATAQEIMVGGGGGTESDGFGVQSGSVYIAVGKPGLMFGTMKKPEGESELAYLILFRHQVTDGSQIGNSNQTQAVGGETMRATLSHTLELHSKKLALAEEIECDPATKAFKSETATINGQKVEMKEGRVFLVDFTGDKLTWKQVKAKLPTKLPNTLETDGIRELVKRVMAELPPESKEVREFLK
jgi:hypothetical protein